MSRRLQPVLATFFLDDRSHIKKAEVESLANRLADLVAENCPGPNSTLEVPRGWDEGLDLPGQLHSLSVHRLDVVTKTFFSSPGATWVPRLSRLDVERVLSSKNARYAAYRAKCDEAWLVISADTETMATWFEFDEEVLGERFVTPFDRVFLARHFARKVTELTVRGGGA